MSKTSVWVFPLKDSYFRNYLDTRIRHDDIDMDKDPAKYQFISLVPGKEIFSFKSHSRSKYGVMTSDGCVTYPYREETVFKEIDVQNVLAADNLGHQHIFSLMQCVFKKPSDKKLPRTTERIMRQKKPLFDRIDEAILFASQKLQDEIGLRCLTETNPFTTK